MGVDIRPAWVRARWLMVATLVVAIPIGGYAFLLGLSDLWNGQLVGVVFAAAPVLIARMFSLRAWTCGGELRNRRMLNTERLSRADITRFVVDSDALGVHRFVFAETSDGRRRRIDVTQTTSRSLRARAPADAACADLERWRLAGTG